jgi:DNA-binding response OmpR family regulator
MTDINNKEINIERVPLINKSVFQIANIVFDYENMVFKWNDYLRKLTWKEADLLKLFFLNKNNVLTREFILKTIWGDDSYFLGRSMDVYISKLRKYLKLDGTISIVTIHGIGFKLEVDENHKS